MSDVKWVVRTAWKRVDQWEVGRVENLGPEMVDLLVGMMDPLEVGPKGP